MLDTQTIPFDDYDTWKLIQSGKTIGVFQCESYLVQHWLKKIKPTNIWELSAVIALVRPGALDSGMTKQYVENKENGESVSFGNDVIDNIFKSTHGVLNYQEQLILLGQRLAWQHLDETSRLNKSDDLRKAVGKKDQAKILAIGKEFVDGCTHNGVSSEIADRLFEIIKSCGRYLFNLSHSISYAYITYRMAWVKTHYPTEFFISSLNYSLDKNNSEDEIHQLIQDAKSFGFTILSPNINYKNLQFECDPNIGMTIRYGLKYIKYVGSSLDENITTLPNILSWKDVFAISIGDLDRRYSLRSNVIDALVWSNAFGDCGQDRLQLYNAINFCRCFTDRELKYFIDNLNKIDNLSEIPTLVKEISNVVANKKRKNILDSECIILEKNLRNISNDQNISQHEKFYLNGVISKSGVSKYEKFSTHNCFALNQIYEEDTINNIINICVIDSVMIHTIKSGKNAGKKMAKIKISDSSGEIDNLPIFSNIYDKYSDLLVVGNTVQMQMSFSPKYKLSVKSITQIC